MQIAGRRCQHCSQRVLVAREAQGCPSCDVVFHFDCLGEIAPVGYRALRSDAAGTCPQCGQPFSRSLEAEEKLADAEARQLVARGRLHARVAVAAFLVPTLVAEAASLASGRAPFFRPCLRALVALVLCTALATGRTWARQVMVFLSGLAALIATVGALGSTEDPGALLGYGAAAGCYVYVVATLGFSSPVRSYLQQKEIDRTGRATQ